MNKRLPLGTDNFETIRKNDFYYVDKTNLIRDLLNNKGIVNLFMRPCGFGNTLNMSILKFFFDIGTDKSLFDGLAISKEKELCEQYMGKYPVISISFEQAYGSTFESAYNQLRYLIWEKAVDLKVLRYGTAIDNDELESYNRICSGKDDVTDIKNSLLVFARLLEKQYNQKVIILIDKYDTPLAKAYANGYYSQMWEVIHDMLLAVFKSNDTLFFGVLTGGLKISDESNYAGLDNLNVLSMTDELFDKYFGFTDDEVKKILKDFNLESHYEILEQWYGGYLFGKEKIYCPWKVTDYCSDVLFEPNKEPQAYWLDSSSKANIIRLLNKANGRITKEEVEKLIAGETINKRINEQLNHSEIDDSVDNVWSLLYMTGYLTLASEHDGDDTYNLKIPNQEIIQVFKQQVLKWFKTQVGKDKGQLEIMHSAFENGDVDSIVEILNQNLFTSVSYYDENGSFYREFLLILLAATDKWEVFL